jgi:hypothetical protein
VVTEYIQLEVDVSKPQATTGDLKGARRPQASCLQLPEEVLSGLW